MKTLAFIVLMTPGLAEDIRIDLDRRDDPRVASRVDAKGYAIHVAADGYLQKLEPTTIAIATQQKGRWVEPRLECGRYLKAEFDAAKPERIRVETTLVFDLTAADRRFSQERDAIAREAQKRTNDKGGALTRVRSQLLLERIAAIREENIRAGADKRGKVGLHTPPLPRQALNFEKPDALERLLKEECAWQSVAQVFKATQFQPPDEGDYPDFAASMVMAEEIRQAMMGNKVIARYLSDSQYKSLEQGSRYELTARYVPELEGFDDQSWKTAPAARLEDGLVKRVVLEGTLDRQRGPIVSWWRIECDSPNRIQPQMALGDGDCFWTWVESPDAHVRYLRLLLHSPTTRYRMNLGLIGASGGEELVLYEGPTSAPVKAPY